MFWISAVAVAAAAAAAWLLLRPNAAGKSAGVGSRPQASSSGSAGPSAGGISSGNFSEPSDVQVSVSTGPGSAEAPTVISSHGTPGTGTISYRNDPYGFTFTLPASWKGFTVVSDEWKGRPLTSAADSMTLSGPLLSIRHPKWTQAKPYQDLPVMILTHKQWDALQNGDFSIGASPTGPTEYGRNARYVFALPARWDFSPRAGLEEAERIISGNPLHPIGAVSSPPVRRK